MPRVSIRYLGTWAVRTWVLFYLALYPREEESQQSPSFAGTPGRRCVSPNIQIIESVSNIHTCLGARFCLPPSPPPSSCMGPAGVWYCQVMPRLACFYFHAQII